MGHGRVGGVHGGSFVGGLQVPNLFSAGAAWTGSVGKWARQPALGTRPEGALEARGRRSRGGSLPWVASIGYLVPQRPLGRGETGT